jgi:hypothetical protein
MASMVERRHRDLLHVAGQPLDVVSRACDARPARHRVTARALPDEPGPPARLGAYAYDVWPDGKRFIVNTLTEAPTSSSITMVLNWMSTQQP